MSAPASRPSVRHVILDRDGVLNREATHGGYVCTPAEFHWLPRALEGLALLHAAGVQLSVATNQSGVGRGIMTLQQLARVHAHMQAEAAANGAPLDAVLFCPHAPAEGCTCRKPAPGLIERAVTRSGIPGRETLVIGDDERDLEAARRAQVGAVLVRTGKGRRTEAQFAPGSVAAYDDLLALAQALLG